MTEPAIPARGPAAAPERPAPVSPPLTEERVTALVLSYRQTLLRYVTGLLPADPQRAEDVVQETLLRAWLESDLSRVGSARHEAGWEPGLPWLFRVARNVVIDWSRRDRSRPAVPTGLPPETAGPADEAARVVERTHVVELLAQLSRPHREVLVYTYLLGCSGPDTAHALGIPPGTVKSRLHHAMHRLRRAAAPDARDRG
ncbi:sigma-70 family RNA polymerase sigma factor [Streptomyces paromomycinus]|uniref:RNA polymerase sigma factor n=1 Tax=Streptomyces paromomycinus TaxID=92743 RepID=A0A401WBB9_STREY|nr:sigma-70 family RNA polymerase sigma factor [Streptomyces paromomycinus]GCD46560.1 RNA polymerase sigma factor [Streptomyces paromomycinus]